MAAIWERLALTSKVLPALLAPYAVGDLLYASDAATLSKLAGNALAARKFLSSVGDGVNPAPPSWFELTVADLPSHKHSALWASDGTPQAVWVDAAGKVGVNVEAA
jgi:hypothetical protein